MFRVATHNFITLYALKLKVNADYERDVSSHFEAESLFCIILISLNINHKHH